MNCFQRPARRSRRGQAAVETALVLPIFLVVLMGIIECSRALYAYSVVSNAAREGARYGIMHPTWTNSNANPDPDNIEARARRFTVGLDRSLLTVTTTLPDGTTNKNDRIRVAVAYSFRMVLPFTSLPLRSSATMRIE
jgi:Flp pilus assembly protein TadG